MAQVNLPTSLAATTWEKHKSALAKLPKAPPTKLGDELKQLARLHAAVEWDAFGADKVEGDAAKSRLDALEAAARGKFKALTDQVQAVEAAAAKFETDARKDKAFPKEPLATLAAIAKDTKALRGAIAGFVDDARKALAAKAAKKGAAKADAKPAAAANAKTIVLVRTRGLEAIRKAKKAAQDPAAAAGQKPTRFLVVLGKTQVATYMGPSVGPTQEKLLKALLPGEAPYKVFKDQKGEIVWEKKAITFVSDVLPAGIAKKMQLWLKPVLKLTPKIRVRRTSGEAEETDGDDIPDDLLVAEPGTENLDALEAELDSETVEVEEAAEAEAPAAGASQAEAALAADAAAPATDKALYEKRSAALKQAMKKALAADHPESTRLRALMGFASEEAYQKNDYAGALKALDMLEQTLGATAAAAAPVAPGGGGGRIAPAVVYQQSRLAWGATRAKIRAELKKLEDAILADYAGTAIEAEVGSAVRRLDGVLEKFDESLLDRLDSALNSAEPAEKERWHGEARAVIARYQDVLATDPLVAALDSNPFVPIAVQASLSKTLAALASKIV